MNFESCAGIRLGWTGPKVSAGPSAVVKVFHLVSWPHVPAGMHMPPFR